MTRLAFLLVPLLAFAACKTESSLFCDKHPGDDGCPGDASSGGKCKVNEDCNNPLFPACDTALDNGTCKQCTATSHALCVNPMPRCGSDDVCGACVDDTADCGQGGVCMPSGACVASADVIHAGSSSILTTNCGAAGTACTLAAAITIATAKAMPDRVIVKLDDAGPFTVIGGLTINADVTIDARGATIGRTGGGPVVNVMGNKKLTMYGGTLHGFAGGDGEGLRCMGNATVTLRGTKIDANDQNGIFADNCTLDIQRATITGNSQKLNTFVPGIDIRNNSTLTISQSTITANNGGGIVINSGTFAIVGNLIQGNGPYNAGNPPSGVGGIKITAQANSNDRVEFNTIVENNSQTGSDSPGIHCTATGFTARGNILARNNMNNDPQVGGNCQHAYSDIVGGTSANNNLTADPGLDANFRLTASSQMFGRADPAASLTGIAARDIDDQPRIIRNGATAADIGADQYYPQ
jgi:hypothetical protein